MNIKSSGNKLSGIALGAALLLGCAPTSYVTLLDNIDGGVGKITITGPEGETLVSKANTGAALDGSSKTAFPVDAKQLQKDFGAALNAQPALPVSYLLYFLGGGTELTSASSALLPKIAAEIMKRNGVDISIIGHTDTTGDEKQNERLAYERAVAVSHYFDPAKLQIKEITVTSHGEKNLLIKTGDNVSEARNRRVEISVR